MHSPRAQRPDFPGTASLGVQPGREEPLQVCKAQNLMLGVGDTVTGVMKGLGNPREDNETT